MSIKKQYQKAKPVCKVTFRMSKKDVCEASNVNIVGGFNNWSTKQTPMKKLKDGSFSLTMDLMKDCEYHFRYLIDDQIWANDPEADKYLPSGYSGSDNSVIVL
ncbi:MAG: isoamylase early set domain-containing protein [Desulfobacteraceae bacterium]|nr:isoamylase early set domain-containing protein [Desulfobacteraceae bacterium]